MIVKGSFDPTDGRPYVQGLLLIPRWRKLSRIDFLVDTGSDVTTLSPGDGTRMGSTTVVLIIEPHSLALLPPTRQPWKGQSLFSQVKMVPCQPTV